MGRAGCRRSDQPPFVLAARLALAVLSLVVMLGEDRALAQSGGAPVITSLTASPNPVSVGGVTTVKATVDQPSSVHHVVIINSDTGQLVNRCVARSTPCQVQVEIPFAENENPQPRHYAASVVPQSAPSPTSGGTPLTLDVRPFTWAVGLSATKNPVTVGETTRLTATVDRDTRWTGYIIAIVDESTGQTVNKCAGTTCMYDFTPAWSENHSAASRTFRAEVRRDIPNGSTAGSARLELDVNTRYFGVSLWLTSTTDSTGTTTYQANATANPALSFTPFTIQIHNQTGTQVNRCVLWITCSVQVGPGTYYATVRDDAGRIYGQSRSWYLPPTGAPVEASADDLDLVSLAGQFASATAICNMLLGMPGTHTAESSVTDQWLACDAASRGGAPPIITLREIAAAAGGTAILWLIWRELELETVPGDPIDPPAEPQPTPPPPPLLIWPNTLNSDAQQLLTQNPGRLDSLAAALAVMKQCQQLTHAAGIPRDRCLDLPIFASGQLDYPEPTTHDHRSVLEIPGWVLLHQQPRDLRSSNGWQYSHPDIDADDVCPGRVVEFQQCHEFPYIAVKEGGHLADPLPRFESVNASQNGGQGGKLRWFFHWCGLNLGGGGKPFLNIPMPPGSPLPTFQLCNGHG